MQLGVCVRDLPTAEVVELARLIEPLGYSHLYLPEAGQVDAEGALAGRDPFLTLAAVFEATSTLVGAVGVAPTIFHRMAQLALRAATLAEQSAGRFQLGVGVSHREAAARFGVTFPASPLANVQEAVLELQDWRSRLRFGQAFPLLVGALGPKMVALGASAADGVVLNWLTPAAARATVRTARDAAAATQAAPLSVLYIRIGQQAVMQLDAVNYDRMANYHRHFTAQGLATPEAIVSGTCLPMEDLGRVRAAIDAYAEAGIDVLCLYTHGLESSERGALLEALAPG